jgi:hypothetical protein
LVVSARDLLAAATPIRISERVDQDETCDEAVLVRRDGGEFGTVFDYYAEKPGVGLVRSTKFSEGVVAAVNEHEALLDIADACRHLDDGIPHTHEWRRGYHEPTCPTCLLDAALARLDAVRSDT